MANIFSRIRDSFRKATSSNVAASDRNKSSGRSSPSTAAGRVAQNLLSDIAISFGNTAGVSEAGMKDYEERTARSKAAMEALQAQNQKDSGSSSTPTPTPPPVTPPPPPPATPTPPAPPPAEPVKLTPETKPDPVAVEEPDKQAPTEGIGAPVEPDVGAGTTTAVGAEEEADTLEAGATGDAEKKVADTIRKKGRRSTIQTTSQGLLSEAPTRRRRSLMGGGLLT